MDKFNHYLTHCAITHLLLNIFAHILAAFVQKLYVFFSFIVAKSSAFSVKVMFKEFQYRFEYSRIESCVRNYITGDGSNSE